MQRKRIIKFAFIMIILMIVFAICSVVGVLKLKREKIKQTKVFMYRAISYGRDLNIEMGDSYDFNPEDGTFDEDKLYNYEIYDWNVVYIRVAYYNLENNCDLSYDALLHSYNCYLNGDEEGAEDIRSFHLSRTNNKNVVLNGEEITEADFVSEVMNVAKDKYNIRWNTVTREQLDDAISVVINGN